MTEYTIFDKAVVISTELENDRYVRRKTKDLILQIGPNFDKWYSSQYNCETVYKNAENVFDKTLTPIVREGVKILNEQGVYSIDEKIFMDKYLSGCADKYYSLLEIMRDRINEIEGQKQLERDYREVRKAGRGRVIGGGFGLGGALKGMATAGVMNATTGLAHSIGNAVGNMGSSLAASSSKSAIYKNAKSSLEAALFEAAFTIQDGIRYALEKEAHIKCKYVTDTECSQADAIIKNYKLGRIPDEQKKELLIRALLLNPYSEEVYEVIWNDYGDKNGDLRRMSTYFGGSLELKIKEDAEKYGINLFCKNCTQYVIAYNKEKAAIQCEQQIKDTLNELIKYCTEHDISEELIPNIESCRRILKEVDAKLRTVDGIGYDTRELAEKVRNDYKLFYEASFGKNFYDSKTYEYVVSREYNTKEFKSNINNLYLKEQNLRTPSKIYENITELISNKMRGIDIGKIDVPYNLGDFQGKEMLIREITAMPNYEVPLFLFDRSSSQNGKSGLLLTNFALRIYSKGIFSNDNQGYPIEQVEEVECEREDKFIIHFQSGESINTSLKLKNIEAEVQVALGKVITDVIKLINNLLPEDKTQLNRILNGVITCECGVKLLQGEIICPSCGRMLRDDGIFVKTQICSNCKNIIPVGKKFCSRCGASLMQDALLSNEMETITETKCPTCNNVIKQGKKFCSYCGTKI